MQWTHILAVATGAVGGAVLRWRIGTWLNASWAILPLGTLLANVLGCFLMGMALAANLPEQWKLLIATGFLGSLTTFSTFSVELLAYITQEKWSSMAMMLLLHIGGGVFAVVLGMMAMRWVLKM